jgi:hypothetical protein
MMGDEVLSAPIKLEKFFAATREFADTFSASAHNVLLGVTDGKAVGTYIERQFQEHLLEAGVVALRGNAAKGIDLPALDTDIKVTSIRQPQSSSSFTSYRQKIEGLGYNIVLFVYDKQDRGSDCFIPFVAVRFIPKELTGDYQATRGLREIIARGGNQDDIMAFLLERMIPVDELTLAQYASELLDHPPRQGYLTISNALQWRLQYRRVISEPLDGIVDLYSR